jgi:hypothetical protein
VVITRLALTHAAPAPCERGTHDDPVWSVPLIVRRRCSRRLPPPGACYLAIATCYSPLLTSIPAFEWPGRMAGSMRSLAEHRPGVNGWLLDRRSPVDELSGCLPTPGLAMPVAASSAPV